MSSTDTVVIIIGEFKLPTYMFVNNIIEAGKREGNTQIVK